MSAPVNPCNVVSAVLAYEYQLLYEVNAKFYAMQRLVTILFESGEALLHLIPNPANFVPVGYIDLSTYNMLVYACPSLNLPPASSLSLAELQPEVEAAYLGFFTSIFSNHPWSTVQSYIARANSEINQAIAKLGSDWLACASAMCYGVNAIANDISNVTDSLTAERQRFSDLASGKTSLLNPTQQAALQDFSAKQAEARNLFMSETTKQAWDGFFPPIPVLK